MPQNCYYIHYDSGLNRSPASVTRVNEVSWPLCTHAHGVCRLWCIDVVWELFSGRRFDFP